MSLFLPSSYLMLFSFFIIMIFYSEKRTFFRAVVTLQDCHCGPTLRTLLISFPERSPLFSFLWIGIFLCLFIGQYISSWVSWLREFHSLVESDGRFPTSSFAHLTLILWLGPQKFSLLSLEKATGPLNFQWCRFHKRNWRDGIKT